MPLAPRCLPGPGKGLPHAPSLPRKGRRVPFTASGEALLPQRRASVGTQRVRMPRALLTWAPGPLDPVS